ncbi:glycosyltransferase family 39 protein [Patescibacteria group bacterium]|nr:glycosyltransferase family 39 protein [Patescibacteria group bacterium]MCL5798008.1 glycosyltransferase family 39 protein [Patescibacteria group bacterium]
MRRHIFLLVSIFILACILRLYQLGKTPISLEWDEVAIGYDAYSILHTGRDQFGTLLPLTFRSLDDYKPPIYEYITVPSVAIFGLNSFGVRFPSAFFGILTVIATYFLIFTIMSKVPRLAKGASYIAFLAAFLLSVSPWHLQFSRAAFEVNVSVFITVVAVYLFIAGLEKSRLFVLSALFFGLDLFSYHSTRVVAPLLLVSLFLLFNRLLPKRKYVVRFSLIFAVFFAGFISILLTPGSEIRFQATNIFNAGARYLNEKDLEKIFLDQRLLDAKAGFAQAGKIFHNQRFIYSDYDTLVKAFNHYLSNFGFEFLFIRGDAPLHHAPGFGLIYVWELPFILLGILYILKNGLNRYSLILPLWFLFVPIPDAVTREAPHAVRSELFLPLWQTFAAIGLFVAFDFVRKESRWVVVFSVLFALSTFMVDNSYYLHQYYVHTNYELSKNWLYGRKQAVEYTENVKGSYDHVLVSMHVDMPYIFWLFYSKYPPAKYLAAGGTVSGGFADQRNHFDKYEFKNFNYNNLPTNETLLLVGVPGDFPPDARILKTIRYIDGTKALEIVENR